MGKSDLPNVSSVECRSVLDSIQNEFDQLQSEDSTLSKLHEDLTELLAQRNILTRRKGFNDKYCIVCCSAFNLLFKRKLVCSECNFYVCRSCSLWDHSTKQWICSICEKQKLFNSLSHEWLKDRLKVRFGSFCSAKALQTFWRLKRISDSENDSGYGAVAESPLMKLLSSHSLNRDLRMTDCSSHDGDCEEEDEEVGDEEELSEIHYSIETILEGLLGGSLDDALVDHLYPDSPIYVKLFSTYHVKLIEVIQNLSKALQKALHNLPAENGITPTSAHAALKSIINTLVEESQVLPPLQSPNENELELEHRSSFEFADIFSSYDSLVATAIINKVIQECQSKFKKPDCTTLEQVNDEVDNHINVIEEESEVFTGPSETSTAFDLPVECVHIEEIEEITQEYTDSDDDKLSSISKWSTSLQSIDDVGLHRNPETDPYTDGTETTPFPEFGYDLVDDPEKFDSGIVVRPTSVTSWEENWLFRKKKRVPLYSNLKYQLLTYCDEPPCMLIPCPSVTSDPDEQDAFSSELSETNSAGSLEFSSDNEEEVAEVDAVVPIPAPRLIPSKSEQLVAHSSLPMQIIEMSGNESPEKVPCPPQDVSKDNFSQLPKEIEAVTLVFVENESKESTPESTKIQHIKNYNPDNCNQIIKDKTESNFVSSPPRPGTIAEREHQKWQNAAPLPNNPYSAENIYKRIGTSKKSIMNEPVSTYEEFERKLSVSSQTSDPGVGKVNCGPKSIDTELYKRDYYINSEIETSDVFYPLQKSEKGCYSGDGFDGLPEEALNSFEEKIYVKSGQVFTLENRIRRLEREIKDPPVSPDLSENNRPCSTSSKQKVTNGTVHENVNCKPILPSVKGIATKFYPESAQVFSPNPLYVSNKVEPEKVKKSMPCRKVHSLTARSLSREFRDLAKVNLPKPMNRTMPVLIPPPDDHIPSDNNHGYTSDESNASSSQSATKRHISRSILERATYWERRAEQGLLSDASVSEEFPGVEVGPE